MIIYKDITFDQIQIIKELWEKNRIYHEKTSEYFGKQYSDVIFEERMNSFAPLDYNHLKITIAENSENGKILGYCISAFEGNSGQPHSLHVLEEARGKGIGNIPLYLWLYSFFKPFNKLIFSYYLNTKLLCLFIFR